VIAPVFCTAKSPTAPRKARKMTAWMSRMATPLS
jgi:hypothetical protein